MDVAAGPSNMPIFLIWAFVFFATFLGLSPKSLAATENQPMHWSGDKTVWDRRNNIVELTGNATITQPGETMIADFIRLNLNDRTVEAKGHCVFSTRETLVQGDEFYFNLDTRIGSIIRGRVSNESFVLMGERINKLGPGRFQSHRAEYSTCKDCPNSWSLLGDDVDMQIEGYAYISNVAVKVKDTPVMWLPYMIIPLKGKRQTGFLFPRFGNSAGNGFMFVQPFFWAINRSTDMTVSAGLYSNKGRRLEWEGRYALASRSTGTFNIYSTADRSAGAPTDQRWGFKAYQTQELPFKIDEKLRFQEVSDNKYPIDFGSDMPGRGDSVLPSDFILSHSNQNVAAFVAAKRYRNLLNTQSQVGFDPNTVQQLPYALMTTNDRLLFGTPLAVGLSLGVANFTRSAGPMDYDITSIHGAPLRPGIDPIRKALRTSVIPSTYLTLRPFGIFSLVPSLQYRNYFYSFQNSAPNLSRGYLIFQTELNAQWERVYSTNNPEIPKVKHLIRPVITYSRIPYKRQDEHHPFVEQVRYRGGYNFDNNDIVPIGTSTSTINYFTPLGHSITYGFISQLIVRKGRLGEDTATYQRRIELQAGQTFNLLELKRPENQQIPLSRVYSSLTFEFENWGANLNYYYYPYLGRLLNERADATKPKGPVSPHEGSASVSYQLEKSVRQKVLSFERSVQLSYSYGRIDGSTSNIGGKLIYSINDYFMPSVGASYDFLTHAFFRNNVDLSFQSPSQCWRVTASVARYIGKPGWDISFDFGLNLTGGEFGSVSGLSSGPPPGT